jgi:hypothetical protein
LKGTVRVSSSISLTNAIASGDERSAAALIANGADVNERTSGGQTALILAVIFGNTKLVQLLIKAGADPHLRDNLGLNAIEWAKRRGSREALAILTDAPEPVPARRRIVVNVEEPDKPITKPPPLPQTRNTSIISDDEKSRRWLAGLRQRLDEEEVRRLNRNEPRPQPKQPEPESPAIDATEPVGLEPVTNESVAEAALETPADVSRRHTGRRRHHIFTLDDSEEPPPPINPPNPTKSNSSLFWILIVITLSAAIAAGSLITAYLYRSNQPATPTAAAPQPVVQKGFPELSGDLVGKAVSLPEAECPLRGPEPVSGTVTVRVMVDERGQVAWARGSGGDWLMRGAATEAAMKSTFAPEKLRGREAEGTITYTFKSQ